MWTIVRHIHTLTVSALRGATFKTKGMSVGDMSVGVPMATGWDTHLNLTKHTPSGNLEPSQVSTTLDVFLGCSLKLVLLSAAAAITAPKG